MLLVLKIREPEMPRARADTLFSEALGNHLLFCLRTIKGRITAAAETRVRIAQLCFLVDLRPSKHDLFSKIQVILMIFDH